MNPAQNSLKSLLFVLKQFNYYIESTKIKINKIKFFSVN